jgi:gluconokinase
MILVIMGVAGAGKTTIGSLLAAELGWTFADADSYHSAENIKKMAAGKPLSDEDRAPWLASLRGLIQNWVIEKQNAVLACSALRKFYREQLQVSPEVKIVYLRGSLPLIHQRLLQRSGHYMDPKLLQSQFDTLEEPSDAVVFDVSAEPAEIVRGIRLAFTSELRSSGA